MQTPGLFIPLRFGPMVLTGRYIRSGTSEGGSESDGIVRDALIDMYAALARGGTPLICTGYAYVRRDGRSNPNQNGIHADRLIPQWRRVTDAVHEANPECRIAMQVAHGGRQCEPSCVPLPLCPSAVPDSRYDSTPREVTEPEVLDLIEAFGQAARRVKAAGFDAVQLHAAHGYLISQFLSPHTNRRTDAWGGTHEKRMRFLRDILSRTRREVGENMAILVKINCDDCLPGGVTPAECADTCLALVEDGIDGVELSAWMGEADPALTPSRKVDPAPGGEGYYLAQCLEVRKRLPAGVPLGMCGGWRSRGSMQRMIRDEGFDFLAASRPFIAEPDVFLRLRAGQARSACNSCNECIEGDRTPVVHCPPAIEGRLHSEYLAARVEARLRPH